ncbi:MAG: cytochrome C oxidase subunit IV family protein [Bacteroidota bacterium]
MGHHSYEEAKKAVFRGFWLLFAVTLIEVGVSLAGKGHIPGLEWLEDYQAAIYSIGFIIIVLSLYKAYFIVYEFMHMGLEVPGLRMSVLLPMLLLVWAIIAFFNEGTAWGNRRQQIKDKDKIELVKTQTDQAPETRSSEE